MLYYNKYFELCNQLIYLKENLYLVEK